MNESASDMNNADVDFEGDPMAAVVMSRVRSHELIEPLTATVYNDKALNENSGLRKPPMNL